MNPTEGRRRVVIEEISPSIDHGRYPTKRIIGDMPRATADEPYAVFYAGRDVSDEATVSPVDVAAIVFEDEAGGVRLFACNQFDRARNVAIEFRGG